MKKPALIAYKVAAAGLVAVAIGAQLQYTLSIHGSVVNFLSFFTIESNIIAAALMLVSAEYIFSGRRRAMLGYLRGGAALYMVITGVVYATLLAKVDVGLTLPWVNTVLHQIFPIVALLDWLLDPPLRSISLKYSLVWLAFPIAYLVYTLIRGTFVHWYPYPFLDAHMYGYAYVAIHALGIAIAAAVLAIALTYLSHLRVFRRTH